MNYPNSTHIVLNSRGNYIDCNSGLLFDKHLKFAYGRQMNDITVGLTYSDIYYCKGNNIKFVELTPKELYKYSNNKENIYYVLSVVHPSFITQQVVKHLVDDGTLDIHHETDCFQKYYCKTFEEYMDTIDPGFLNFMRLSPNNSTSMPYLYHKIRNNPKDVHSLLVNCEWEDFNVELIKLLVSRGLLNVDEISPAYDGEDAHDISFRQHLKLLCDEYVVGRDQVHTDRYSEPNKDRLEPSSVQVLIKYKLYKQLLEINNFVLKI